MAEWALLALRAHTSKQVVLTHDPEVAQVLEVPGRPDSTPGLGPLGGLLTALEWAEELGMERLFLLACDLPLVGPELVKEILTQWPQGHKASVPRSEGPLRSEPLCAGYSVAVLPEARRVARSPDRAMERLLAEVGAPPVTPRGWSGDELALAFTNVNTRDEARRAEELLRPLRRRKEEQP
jgi:molybdopterin-guanine dinucleotide biosynthesis protein A